MLGIGEIFVIGAAIVIFFTWRRLPEAIKSAKKSAKLFKSELKGEGDTPAVRDVNRPAINKENPKDSRK